MNATTRKAGTKRAAFAIEDAIADTRAKIERSATADLKAKAQDALAKPAEEMTKLAEHIRATFRAQEIAIVELNAQRWELREKAARAMLRGIEVNDYGWGACFEGTKAALVRAGLIDAKTTPTTRKDAQYTLPLNHSDGYMAACYGPTFGGIPPSWDVRCSLVEEVARAPKGNPLLAVHVSFRTRDLEVRERAACAIAELDRPDMNTALLRSYILRIPPVPLSVQVPEEIKAAKKYPTEKQRLAWHHKQDRKRK